MKIIDFSYQKNARDLGGMVTASGLRIKEGRLFRSGKLSHVSKKDISLIKELGITDIIDFRSRFEFEAYPDYAFEGVEAHCLTPYDDFVSKEQIKKHEDGNLLYFVDDTSLSHDRMLEFYRLLASGEVARHSLTLFFNLLLDKKDGVFLFHCSQGKDRAGVAAFLLEIALGVSFEDAIDDYMFTNHSAEKRLKQLIMYVKDKPFFNKEYVRAMNDVFTAKKEYIMAFYDEIIKNYGSFDSYFKKILKIDVDELRNLYCEAK